MRRSLRITLALGMLAYAVPSHAIFVGGVQQLSQEQAEAQAKLSFVDWTGKALEEALRKPVGGLALSFDYRYGTQDFTNRPRQPTPAFDSETELNSYILRPEFVVSNWLSIYAIAARHEGTSRSAYPPVDLDGWGAGLGVTASLGLPPVRTVIGGEPVSFVLPFVLPDFNWTHNEFEGIDNGIDIYNVTTRIGGQARTDTYSFGLYAGPMYQQSTQGLVVGGNAVSSVARDAWSGVVGAFFGVRLVGGDDSLEQRRDLLRPTLLLTVEGGVGNRQGVLASLRYEYDLLGAFTGT